MTGQTETQPRRAESYLTDDVDLLSRRYHAAPIDYVQVDAGALGAEIHATATSKVEVREAHFHASVLNTVHKRVGRFGLGLGITGHAQFQGTRCNDSNLAYSDCRNGVIARISAGSSWCNLSIDDTLLQEVAAVHGYTIPAGNDGRGMSMSANAALASKLCRMARSQEGTTLSNEQFDDAMALLLLRSLNPPSTRPRMKPDKCWTVAHTIIDFIRANYAEPMTLTALCQLVDVSERALRYNFQKATGLSLQEYLTHYRLHRARALLVNSEVAEVKEAAAACGIPHAGRFSQYYKAMFRESPGEVLRQPAPVYRGRRDH